MLRAKIIVICSILSKLFKIKRVTLSETRSTEMSGLDSVAGGDNLVKRLWGERACLPFPQIARTANRARILREAMAVCRNTARTSLVGLYVGYGRRSEYILKQYLQTTVVL